MKTEFEARVLDISFDAMINNLKAINAISMGAFYQKRYVYDFVPPIEGKWIRLRSNG